MENKKMLKNVKKRFTYMGSGAGRLLKADRPMHHQLHHSLYTKCNSNSVTILKDRQTDRQTDRQQMLLTDKSPSSLLITHTHTPV